MHVSGRHGAAGVCDQVDIPGVVGGIACSIALIGRAKAHFSFDSLSGFDVLQALVVIVQQRLYMREPCGLQPDFQACVVVVFQRVIHNDSPDKARLAIELGRRQRGKLRVDKEHREPRRRADTQKCLRVKSSTSPTAPSPNTSAGIRRSGSR